MKHHAHIFGSGTIIHQALRAQTILAEKYGVGADVWSATNYKWLRNDALAARRWNMLHPTEEAKEGRTSKRCWKNEKGTVHRRVRLHENRARTRIAPWVPGGLMTLGTDGFGRSDTRAKSAPVLGSGRGTYRHRHALRVSRKRPPWKRRLSKKPSKT